MMHLFFDSAWRVAVWGLVLGAGVPLVFAVGVRQFAGTSDTTEPSALNRALGVLCYALLVFTIVAGLMVIIAAGLGKAVSFEHVFPTFVAKS